MLQAICVRNVRNFKRQIWQVNFWHDLSNSTLFLRNPTWNTKSYFTMETEWLFFNKSLIKFYIVRFPVLTFYNKNLFSLCTTPVIVYLVSCIDHKHQTWITEYSKINCEYYRKSKHFELIFWTLHLKYAFGLQDYILF